MQNSQTSVYILRNSIEKFQYSKPSIPPHSTYSGHNFIRFADPSAERAGEFDVGWLSAKGLRSFTCTYIHTNILNILLSDPIFDKVEILLTTSGSQRGWRKLKTGVGRVVVQRQTVRVGR